MAASKGFSLVEIAVVLVILTILFAVTAIPLATQINQRRIGETQRLLDLANQALIGYASANGRLPCPATDGLLIGTVNSLGDERFATGGNASNGQCEFWVGFLPAVALGLSPVDDEGFMLDGWGTKQNRIRYAVWGNSVIPDYSFTKTDGIKIATTSVLAATTKKLLFVCQSAPTGAPLPTSTVTVAANVCGTSVKLTDKAPTVVYSLGANAATGGIGADELHNVNQDFVFVSHTATPAGSAQGEFDDSVSWMSLNILFNCMQNAGRL